jgi:DNA-binding NarL/FixJ family response regulator
MAREQSQFTQQERRVLWLVAKGRTNRGIGYELGLSPNKVAQTLGALYRKTNIHQPKEPYDAWELRGRLCAWALDYFSARRGQGW